MYRPLSKVIRGSYVYLEYMEQLTDKQLISEFNCLSHNIREYIKEPKYKSL